MPVGGGSGKENPSPPVNRMTDRCKNITLAKTSFRPVIRFLNSKSTDLDWCCSRPYQKLKQLFRDIIFITFISR